MADSAGEEQGATFTVRLPLRAVHSRQEDEERVHPKVDARSVVLPLGSAPNLEGVRVLVVDDEPDTREVLREMLEQCGAE